MCHKLLQVYACGHTKEVCTTPCAHALTTATIPVPAPAPEPPQSSSAPGTPTSLRVAAMARQTSFGSVASLPVAAVGGNANNGTESQRSGQEVRKSSASFTSSPLRNSTANVPPPPYSSHTTRSSNPLPKSQPQSQSYSQPHVHSQLLSDLNLTPDPTPNLCAQFFARYLPAGNHPCPACYMQPQWEALRQRWMRMYFEGHPGCKVGDVGALSGVEEGASFEVERGAGGRGEAVRGMEKMEGMGEGGKEKEKEGGGGKGE